MHRPNKQEEVNTTTEIKPISDYLKKEEKKKGNILAIVELEIEEK